MSRECICKPTQKANGCNVAFYSITNRFWTSAVQFPQTPFLRHNDYRWGSLQGSIWVVRFSVLLLWAASVAALAQAQQQTSSPVIDVSSITVDRKGCFGACPIYTLTLRRHGVSTYVGKTGLRQGLYTAPAVSVADFERLTQAISEIRSSIFQM